MVKILLLDHKEGAKDNACFFYERFMKDISSVKMQIETKYAEERISPDYDCYLIHLSSTDIKPLKQLRNQNPLALIIGISDECTIDSEMPLHLKDILDVYTERAATDRNKDRITRLILSRIK